ncbi:thioesterase family protein [Halobellus limi]|uniref:Thioesterase n=1 Tax=Halobellus limi TaxID=699433 RepID=A0A1H6BPG2_9EURY|nr:thioesterase family protein [Halobellus limi]QCC49401.1 thioesterase [Halobellus limi]SEG62522.1 fluoroacetyl-CoA thioesterase [Halobellus limi]
MTNDIKPGIEHTFTYTVPESKMIPEIFPESDYFQEMPDVLASGYYVALVEWACIEMLEPYLDWPEEQTVGTHFDLSHEAPTPSGTTITIDVEITDVEGRQLTIDVDAKDEVERIGQGTHKRYIVDREQFVDSISDDKL